ncbi:S8 family serine peptidase [Streptomyces sp. NPDC048305]|uniref:S8 family serine peptidase n=1 Tax=Streptomyces sp. NPDC048305 TaxID=3365532 RepID=UPI0037189790
MTRRRPRHGGLLAAALAVALGAPFLGASPTVAAPAADQGTTALRQKAQRQVLADFEDHDRLSFWVQLDSEPDSTTARKAKTKTAKGEAVVKTRKENARKTQAGLKSLLEKADAPYRSYWISNTVRVTGTEKLARQIAARSDVTSIRADEPVPLPEKLPAVQESEVDGVEWNVDRIKAPQVWDELGVRGEGVVVANIDTGVDSSHPALAASYRGRKADGSVDNAYNWFDATGNCGDLGDGGPCDDQGHGTHTMGTMVGDDGDGNRIGVAPGATWIAAKGCGTQDCSQAALLAAGQWILAPTDADGENPRPDLAPDIVNNSWGSTSLDTWYRSMVQAWRDAGIFPAFSAGNNGPSCDTVGAPGAYANSYASGALTITDRIAAFSSRGPGVDGTMKPDIAAPGADIRSAAPGGGYVPKSGTSMASPHTAATVALIWSASPSLRGDVTGTEAVLDSTAHDVDDTTCGGTAADNHVYGEGRLDAYAAVTAAPHDSLGALKGTVTTADGPAADALVAVDGPMHASRNTGKDGTYAFPRLIAGDYTVTVSRFGYLTGTATVTVAADGTATRDTVLVLAPTGTVTGTVSSDSGPEADVVVKVQGTPVTTRTGTDGEYSLTLPVGDYSLGLTPLNKCASAIGTALEVAGGDTREDFALPTRADPTGTTCGRTEEDFPTGDTKLDISSTTRSYAPVETPFPVALYGHTYDKGWVMMDGALAFGYPTVSGANVRIPDRSGSNGVLYPFWDDLRMDDASGIFTGVKGTAPHRSYVVEWRDMILVKDGASRVGFSAEISEDGTYAFHYKGIDAGGKGYEQGSGATIGAENHDGTQGFEYSANDVSVRDGMTLRFRPETSAVVSGTVTDANDGKPVSGAAVTVTSGGERVAGATTRPDGAYLLQIPATGLKEYAVEVTAAHYAGASRTAELEGLSVLRTESALTTGAVAVDRSEGWSLVIPAGETRERGLTLTNSGAAADWTVKEKGGASWLTAGPAQGELKAGGSEQIGLTFSTGQATPGTVLKGTVVVSSESGRAPVFEFPVTLVVPGYQAAVDAGSGNSAPVVDKAGDSWGPDRAWVAGSYGYIGDPKRLKSADAITGTEEQQLYRTAGQGAEEYRFDGVPSGIYQVELGFAELRATKPGRRVFDVSAEGAEKVSNVDISLEAGGDHKVLTKTFTVKVTDGRLDLALTAVKGQTLVNTLRVTHRPDVKS